MEENSQHQRSTLLLDSQNMTIFSHIPVTPDLSLLFSVKRPLSDPATIVKLISLVT